MAQKVKENKPQTQQIKYYSYAKKQHDYSSITNNNNNDDDDDDRYITEQSGFTNKRQVKQLDLKKKSVWPKICINPYSVFFTNNPLTLSWSLEEEKTIWLDVMAGEGPR